MTRPSIFFAHANGFPAGTYTKIFADLKRDFDLDFIDRLGHDPHFPVTDNWPRLREELRRTIETRHTQPVIGVGHSLGGVLHLMVACERPELYSQLILLDAPIISRLSSHGLRILKVTRLIDRYSPSQITRFRRNLWKTRDEAFRHFLSKPKFASFDREVLRDYVEHGTIETEKGFSLFFSPQIEARIYRTIPHHLPKLRGRLRVPTVYVGGTESREGRLARLSFMEKHFGIRIESVPGTHLFPFEDPVSTASKIKSLIAGI
jgi:pimeloyl-ACP methyl ester carboxylesterase